MMVKLTYGEQAQHWAESREPNIKAFEAFMKGHDCFNRQNKEDNAQARAYYQKSLVIDPSVITHVMIGFTHLIDLMYGWSESQIESFAEADKCSAAAYELNQQIDLVRVLLGWIYLYKGKHSEAVEEGKKATKLNPNGAEVHAHLGMFHAYNGNPNEAIRLIKMALRLNPSPPIYYYEMLGASYVGTQQYEEAISVLERSIKLNPNGLPAFVSLAICHASMNQIDQALKTVGEILRLDPDYKSTQFAMTMPYKDKAQLDRYVDALRKAGLPD